MPRMLRRTASSGLRPVEVAERLGLEAAGVPRVAVDDLALGLVGREHDLVGVHDDDVVAGVEMRGEGGLVLAAQDPGDLGGEAAEDHALGIDDVPGTLDL